MKTLLLIDANSLIHRSFHALPPFTAPGGEPTGALYGLSSILLKIAKEQEPDYWAAAFDRPEPTFRKELFKDYWQDRDGDGMVTLREILENYAMKDRVQSRMPRLYRPEEIPADALDKGYLSLRKQPKPSRRI